jgi:hypothetical protein
MSNTSISIRFRSLTKEGHNLKFTKLSNELFVYFIAIAILGIIHRPVFYFKHDVSETGIDEACLCPRRQRVDLCIEPN